MKRIKVTQFSDILHRIPEDKRMIGEKIVSELEFMEEALKRLKAQILENGEVENFKQGKQCFMRESPALKGYNMTIRQYSTLYKQLCDLMGKSSEAEKSNAVYDFIKAQA